MAGTRIVPSGLWVALMLTYLLGDVLRIYSGDAQPGEIFGRQARSWMWLAAAIIMLMPIAMVVLTLTLGNPAIRWTNIIVTIFFVVFNILGMPYPSALRQSPDRCQLRFQRADHLVCLEVGDVGVAPTVERVPAEADR